MEAAEAPVSSAYAEVSPKRNPEALVTLQEAALKSRLDCAGVLLENIVDLRPDRTVGGTEEDNDYLLQHAFMNRNADMVTAGLGVPYLSLVHVCCTGSDFGATVPWREELCSGTRNPHCAADVVRALVENDADVHGQALDGRTNKTMCKSSIQLLKEYGASLDVRETTSARGLRAVGDGVRV